MIISRTPFRISFFGGGTDYPAWYRRHGGAALGTTINKYCYITCRYLPPFFDHKFRVVYSKTEVCQRIEEITHPAVREILRSLNIDRGLEIHHDGDLPARSGIGSSSSFSVGLFHALYALKGYMPNKRQLAAESTNLEQECLKENVGSQDQLLAAYGGFNHIAFHQNGEISVTPMTLSAERIKDLNSHLMLLYTGIKRTASDIAGSYVQDIESKVRLFRMLHAMVNESISILNNGDELRLFGELLNEAWHVKRALGGKVTNSHVDAIYEEAISAGAIGGKLLGAGGGGFMILFVRPCDQDRVREHLNKLIYVPFKFETSGSQIIFADQEEDYSREEGTRTMQANRVFAELSDMAG